VSEDTNLKMLKYASMAIKTKKPIGLIESVDAVDGALKMIFWRNLIREKSPSSLFSFSIAVKGFFY